MSSEPRKSKNEKEAHLQADLEATWQEEAPATARRTDFADQVDGEIGTRKKGDAESDDPTTA